MMLELWNILSDVEQDLCRALTSTLIEHHGSETISTDSPAEKQAIELLADLELAEIKNTGDELTATLITRHL